MSRSRDARPSRRRETRSRAKGGGRIILHVDPADAEKLASFFRGLGHTAVVAGTGDVELILPARGPSAASARTELEIDLRVWRVIDPTPPSRSRSSEAP